MHVYNGIGRRQIGGSLWSTIQRGIRPLIMNILTKLKPHAIKAGKKVAGSALSLSTNVATNALAGNLNKKVFKSALKDEVNKIASSARNKVDGFKRKYLDDDDDDQGGKGYKRRRLSRNKLNKKVSKKRKMPIRKANTSKKRSIKRKRTTKSSKRVSKKRRQYKPKSRKRINKGRVGKANKKRRSVSVKAIKDIFQ